MQAAILGMQLIHAAVAVRVGVSGHVSGVRQQVLNFMQIVRCSQHRHRRDAQHRQPEEQAVDGTQQRVAESGHGQQA